MNIIVILFTVNLSMILINGSNNLKWMKLKLLWRKEKNYNRNKRRVRDNNNKRMKY